MNFNRLYPFQGEDNIDKTQKIFTKLLAYGIDDFTEANKIWEDFLEKKNKKFNYTIDLAIYEYLSKVKTSPEIFNDKHLLTLTFNKEMEKDYADKNGMLLKLDKIFPQKIEISSMTPGPIHFGPLEGFLSDSSHNIDLKTLFFTICFWIFIYGVILYSLYL